MVRLRPGSDAMYSVRIAGALAIAALVMGACSPRGASPVAIATTAPPLSASANQAPAAQLPDASAGGNAAWPMYHRDPAHRGVGPSTPVLSAVQPDWAASLDGEVYAEPLVVGSMVVALSEHDTVYALDINSGALMWSQHLGEPVPLSSLPCGNIDPSGLTATPVADPQSDTLYVVGRFLPTHHDLVALELSTGNVRFRRTVDPPDADPRYLQERGAIALANGRVYIPFGGNIGDCGPYRGWVMGAAADGSGDLLAYGV